MFCAAHVGETLRGALSAIPPAQTDAARAIGLTFGQMLVYVLMPQAIRQIAPNFVNTAVEIVKASSLLSAIGVGELLLTTQEIIGRTFKTMEFYALAGGLYLLINLVIGSGRLVARAPLPVALGGSVEPILTIRDLTKTFGAQRGAAAGSISMSCRPTWCRSSAPAAPARRRSCAASTCWRSSMRGEIRLDGEPLGYRSDGDRRGAADGPRARPAARADRHGVPELQPVSRI